MGKLVKIADQPVVWEMGACFRLRAYSSLLQIFHEKM
jgi:hypothetical protein